MISFNLPLVKTKGEVTIAKYDSSKDPAVPLKDVEFGLYSDSECKELIETLKSDASGMLKVENLNVPDGQTRYYLKETKALPGYKIDTQIYTLVPGEAVNGVSTFIVQDENGDTIGTIEIGSKSYPVIYNKKPEPISLSVKKSWLDEDGNEILDPSGYSATFHVHRLKSYTEHIVVDLPAPPTSTLKIGYYYYDGPWWAPVRQYGLYNGLSYDYVAETDATVTYDYNDSHGSHRYIIDGEENNDLPDSGTLTIHMPEAGETTTIYFYD
jgi:hypothetical protein